MELATLFLASKAFTVWGLGFRVTSIGLTKDIKNGWGPHMLKVFLRNCGSTVGFRV